MAGLAAQIFVGLHLYQLHGLPEARFLFFTALTMMVIYEDWKCLWPCVVLAGAMNLFFGLLQNRGVNLGFISEGMVAWWRMGFQFSIAAAHVGLCSYWAFTLRQNTLGQARRSKLLIQQRARLLEQLDRTLRSESDLQVRTKELEEMGLRMEQDLEARREVEIELRRLTNDLENTNEQLERAIGEANQLAVSAQVANQAKSAFLAVMSHEIRTPLNGVLGMTSLLMDSSLTDDQRLSLQTIQTSGNNLLVILNDILDFSKIESGKLQMESLPYSPWTVASGVAELFAAQAQEKGLALSVHASPGVPLAIIGDEGRLRQVISNLVSNAIKFTEQGSVVIEVSQTQELENGDVELRFAIRDSGIGIPEEKQDMLFQAFSQLDNSNSRKHGGTGLGLAISQRLVELMGGKIWVESEKGEGSVFFFLVRAPKASLKEAPRSPDAPRPMVTEPAQSVSVLLVEDNDVNRKVALMMLRKLGYQPDHAWNGVEAIDVLKKRRYDVVLMDWHMPEMNGLEATMAIRKDFPPDQQPWIIGLTANALSGDRERCLEAGMNDYLSKPIRRDEIAAAFSRVDKVVQFSSKISA